MKSKYRKTESSFYMIKGERYTMVALDPLFPETQIKTGILPAPKETRSKIMDYPILKKGEFDKAFKLALKRIKNQT